MVTHISFRINPRIPHPKLRWRALASTMFLSAPLVVIALDTNILQSPNKASMILGTFYLLITLYNPLRRFAWCEIALVLFYPALSTVLLATPFLFLRLWKETKILRGLDDRSRTGMLTDMGFRLKKISPTTPSELFVAAILAWAGLFASNIWGFNSLSWLPFWLFAMSLVSVLTSDLVFLEEKIL